MQLLELSVKNRVDEIVRVNQSFNAFAERHGIPAAVRRKIDVVFDELLNNIVSYAYHDDNEHTIDVRVERSSDRLAVTFTDDGIPFDPFASAAPDTALSLEERRFGHSPGSERDGRGLLQPSHGQERRHPSEAS